MLKAYHVVVNTTWVGVVFSAAAGIKQARFVDSDLPDQMFIVA